MSPLHTGHRPEINSEQALNIAILAMRESVKILTPIADILALRGISNTTTRTARNKRIDLRQAIDILLEITNALPTAKGSEIRCLTCGRMRRAYPVLRRKVRKCQPVR